MANAFILPKGTYDNRVIAAGSEDLNGAEGSQARFFLVGTRPGMAYPLGTPFVPAIQIDPILPAQVTYVLTFPDGRQQTWQGTGDATGSFAGAPKVPLDVSGIYTYTLAATWNGYPGAMPGLPAAGGEFYVYDAERPAGADGLQIDLPAQSTFSAVNGLAIMGISTAASVRYAVLMPGAAIAAGTLPVTGGVFSYQVDPAAIHAHTPLYDIVNAVSGQPQVGRVLHMTFFSAETAPDGTILHDFARVVLRGTQAVVARS